MLRHPAFADRLGLFWIEREFKLLLLATPVIRTPFGFLIPRHLGTHKKSPAFLGRLGINRQN